MQDQTKVYVYMWGLQRKERTVGRERITFEMGFERVGFYSYLCCDFPLYAIK